MQLLHSPESVIQFKNGDIWHFTSTANEGITFSRLNRNNRWNDPAQLIRDAQQHFSLCLDDDNNLHIVFYTREGKLYYMKYNRRTWTQQLVAHYTPTRYIIRFPQILIVDNRIHILLAIGTAFNLGFWAIVHHHLDNGNWFRQDVAKFTAGKILSPFRADHDGKNIYLIYRGLSMNRFQIHYCRFMEGHRKWTLPQNISKSFNDCSMPSLLVKGNILHTAWASIKYASLEISYRRKCLDSHGHSSWDDKITLSDGKRNCSYPQLVWSHERIWCVWHQNDDQDDDLYACYSLNQGTEWSFPKPLYWSHKKLIHCLYYISNATEERDTVKVQKVFADLNEGFKIAILHDPLSLLEKEHNTHQLMDRLEHWMGEVEKSRKERERIQMEFEKIQKNYIKNQQQWEKLFMEYNEIKEDIDRFEKNSFLKRIFKNLKKA
jgi:hypothetical protein